MLILEAQLTEDMRWIVRRSDPAFVDLASLSGLSLLNPLIYPSVSGEIPTSASRFRFGSIVGDSILIETNALVFLSTASETGETDGVMRVLDKCSELVRCLRQVSKQMELARALPAGIDIGREIDKANLASPRFPEIAADSKIWVSNYELSTAVSISHVQQADALILAGGPELHKSVLSDAVLAFLDRDDWRTVLYAALSLEIISETKLRHSASDQRRGRKGETTVERLLHRRPLEAIGRSLKEENPHLFREAEHLYRTRNQIVHEGGTVSKPDSFSLDGPGAWQALQCANNVFKWWGEDDDYLPVAGHVVGLVPVGYTPDLRKYPQALPRHY
jgi:hypothetical protein